MTSKLVVNTIEADTGISSVSFASSISMDSTSKFHFSAAGVDIGADTNINRPAAGVLGFNISGAEKLRIDTNGHLNTSGIVTAANFKSGVTNVHNLGVTLTGGQLDVGSNIKVGTAGVITATSFSGSGANLTAVLKNIVEDTSPQLGADLDTNSFEILFDDAHAAKFGNSSQFQIKHDGGGGDARLINTVGNLYSINSTNGWIILQPVSGQTGINVKPNAAVELMHSGNKKIETTSSGAKVTGNLAFASAGHGIDFSASVHASGMANELLDDYEEGSWTPVFATAGSGGSTVSNPSNTQATYVKVGRIVYLHLGVHGLTKNWAGSNTEVFIRGLPYRSYFQHSGHPVRHGYWGASDDDLNVYAQISQYQTYMSLQKGGGAQGRYEPLYWSDMHWEGYGNLTMEITYETDQGT